MILRRPFGRLFFQEKFTTFISSAPDVAKPVLLYVEDDPAAASLFALVWRDLGYSAPVHIVGNSREALDFLRGRPPFENAPSPDLVVLDINLPGEDGFSTLEKIRSDDQLKDLPAVFFSTCHRDSDWDRAAGLGALNLLQKSDSLEEFEETIKNIHAFAVNASSD